MNTESIQSPLKIVGYVCAVLSVAAFWVLPFSPLLAISAVITTRKSRGWPRTTATLGAVLCIVWTGIVVAILLWLCLLRALHGSWAY